MLTALIRKLKLRARYLLTAARRNVGTAPTADSLDQFLARAAKLEKPRVLELGTKRSFNERPTRHDAWVPHASEFIGSDIEDAVDVDAVAVARFQLLRAIPPPR